MPLTADDQLFLQEWDGPSLSLRAMRALQAGGVRSLSELQEAAQRNKLKWLPGCGAVTERELNRVLILNAHRRSP